ncbi:YcnI family protein [Microbacterium sp. 2FI]|uniref:YcnI family copper-binding membrane protein n=1 Tax=Microbacterium sp. 2FI TaxID=2502193 RepID=UPI0010F900ED|nr:YcnI family protein [Microbacterium sp. 2FI]
MTPSNTPARAGRTLALGTAAGIALAVGVPLAASAHVTVTPDAAEAGAYSVLTFAFSHGCETSPTTALTIGIPDGVDSLAPQIEPGWSIESVGADEGIPTQVVYTADAPVESGLRATVTLQVKFAEDAAGETLAFPVLQTCTEGETDWSELAEAGADPHDLEAPAPVVTVGEIAADAHGDDGGHENSAAAGDAAGSEGEAASPLPVILGTGGLVLGAAALVVAIAALRRSRRA